MPSVSPSQARLMAAAAHTPGGYGGVPQSVGREFNQSDKGSKLLSDAMRGHAAEGGDTGGDPEPWNAGRGGDRVVNQDSPGTTGIGRVSPEPMLRGASSIFRQNQGDAVRPPPTTGKAVIQQIQPYTPAKTFRHGNEDTVEHYAFGGSLGHISIPKMGGSGGLGKLGGIGQIAKPLSVGMEAPFFTREEARGIDRPPSSGGFGGGRGRFAMGGGMSMGQMDPFWTRQEARIDDMPFHGGLIPGSGFGRTDQLPLSVGSESHVIPADAVSGLGQGGTNAGARAWAAAIRGGPYGVAPPPAIKGPGPPSHHPPTDRALAAGIEGGTTKTTSFGSAKGGAEHGGRRTSILAASSEIVVPPEDVEQLGRRGIAQGMAKKHETAMDCGHRLIDEAIANIRKFNIGWLRKAPLPKKSQGGAVSGIGPAA